MVEGSGGGTCLPGQLWAARRVSMGVMLMGSDLGCSSSLRSHSPGLWQRWPHRLSHWFAPDGFTLGWCLGDLMGVRHKGHAQPSSPCPATASQHLGPWRAATSV